MISLLENLTWPAALVLIVALCMAPPTISIVLGQVSSYLKERREWKLKNRPKPLTTTRIVSAWEVDPYKKKPPRASKSKPRGKAPNIRS